VNEHRAEALCGIKQGEDPYTCFKDHMESITVELIDWPDPERLKKVFVNMANASWYRDFTNDATPEEVDESIAKLFSGEVLGQGLEHAKFCFVVDGLTLHGTHSLVRNRIGIAYMQRSLAVSDLRHEDILVPRAFTKDADVLQRYIDWCLTGKQLYADMMDSGEFAQGDARMCLPKTIPSWCYCTATLPTIMSIYSKRSDTQEEHPEMNVMVALLRDLIVEKFPYMEKYFVSACDAGTCLHCKPGYEANCIYKRDAKHQVEGPENWTMHDKTRDELMFEGAEPFVTEEWVSMNVDGVIVETKVK